MYFIGVDLGTTNLKAALYDGSISCVARESEKVSYDRSENRVELDIEQYYESFSAMIRRLLAKSGVPAGEIRSIGFTGQAETLVILGEDGRPLMNAISWMDERSKEECEELAELFSAEEIRRVTGQMAVLPTWPATKILWLKKNRPEIWRKAARYLLLKDYMIWKMTGKMLCDMSIATFSFYFDIYRKCYWKKMMDAVGIRPDQLPPLAEPNTCAGNVRAEAAKDTGLSEQTVVNIGTLDHFAGMIGTGNITTEGVSLSTGTVMALAVMAEEPADPDCGIAMHYGFLPDTHVMLPVVESGGVSLEWFRSACMKGTGYDEINEELAKRVPLKGPIFLPYIVGVNPPEFDPDATGVFWGLRQEHDAVDMAGAVMEGVACILRRNCDSIRQTGTGIERIIATGGGAKSAVWCQMQADLTGLPVVVPKDSEAACLGAAIAAAAGCGAYRDFGEACAKAVSMERQYTPRKLPEQEKRYRRFCALYEATRSIGSIE
ncbi:MAG: hypothetical protein IJJ50_07110 [Lachnospiraceae bacterium]|nr:hypothetical protein [Lachnospiraceae bacterium]